MVDKSPWGVFWQMVGDAEYDIEIFRDFIDTIPKDITKIKDYAIQILSKPIDLFMLPYHFLFLQACAFGGTATWIKDNKWCKAGGLRNYWLPTENSNRRSPVNPMMPMPNSLLNRVEIIIDKAKNIHGYNMDIFDFCYVLDEEWDINKDRNIIIYIDPPYQGTQQYGYSFNIYRLLNEIWNNVPIYVSEGRKLLGTENTYLLSHGRAKGNINGNANKMPVEEWLNKF